MKRIIKSTIGTIVLIVTFGFTNPVNADVIEFTLPAGLACADFDLTITITTSDHYVMKEFKDQNGSSVRLLTAGRGNDLDFVNGLTGASYSIAGNGSVSHTTLYTDGSMSVSVEGHNVLILFPTDFPAGPSTKQYTGRVEYTVDSSGTWTLLSTKGKITDICAILSE